MKISIPNSVKGIIFDLDGTLYKMKWYMKPVMTFLVAPRIFLLPRYMKIRNLYAGKEMTNGDDLLRAMSAELADQSGIQNNDLMLKWIHNKFYRAFEKVMPLLKGSRPGLNDMLAHLKEKRIKLAILSDFAHIEERLGGLCIPCSLFDALIASETEGALKPSARGLTTIAKSWQIKPSDILVIGDRDDTDGIAASNAGMPYLRISDKKTKPVGAHDWKTIKKFLSNLSSR